MCPDCLSAAAKLWHGFSVDCPGCKARAIARGPNFRASQAAGRQSWQYRQELDNFGVSHEDVRKAATADALGKVPA